MAEQLLLSARFTATEADRKSLVGRLREVLRQALGLQAVTNVVVEDDIFGETAGGGLPPLLLCASVSLGTRAMTRKVVGQKVDEVLRRDRSLTLLGKVVVEDDLLAGALDRDETAVRDRPMNFNQTMPPD